MASDELQQAMHGPNTDRLLALWTAGGARSRKLAQALAQDAALDWADRLSAVDPHGPRLAVAVLAEASASPKEVASRLRTLATHPDRAVRRRAVEAFSRQLVARFAQMLPMLESWTDHPHPRVRRAAILATRLPAESGSFLWAEALLDTLAPLLTDRTPAVRNALGPGVLARTFLPRHPDTTFAYLAQWSTSHDEQVLWNVAMALCHQTERHLTRKALILLRRFALDERPSVRAAAASALASLAIHARAVVLPELHRWLTDEDRAPVAEAALRRSE